MKNISKKRSNVGIHSILQKTMETKQNEAPLVHSLTDVALSLSLKCTKLAVACTEIARSVVVKSNCRLRLSLFVTCYCHKSQ